MHQGGAEAGLGEGHGLNAGEEPEAWQKSLQ